MRTVKKLAALLLAAALCLSLAGCGEGKAYEEAATLLNHGKYDEAAAAFEALGGYKDAAEMVTECHYQAAAALLRAGSYDEAIAAFEALGDYKDAAGRAAQAREDQMEIIYQDAAKMMEMALADTGDEYFAADFSRFQGGTVKEYFDIFAKYGADMPDYDEYFKAYSSYDFPVMARVNASYQSQGFKIARDLYERLGSYKDSADLLSRFTVIEEVPLWYTFTESDGYTWERFIYSEDGNTVSPSVDIPWCFEWERTGSGHEERFYSGDGELEKVDYYDVEEELWLTREYKYDGNGNVLSINDSYPYEDMVSRYRFDMSYGENGELKFVDRFQLYDDWDDFQTSTFTYTYGENGLLTQVARVDLYEGDEPAETWTYSYDGSGHLAGIVRQDIYGSSDTYTITCDGEGRPVTVVQNHLGEASDNYSITRSYGYGDFCIYNG